MKNIKTNQNKLNFKKKKKIQINWKIIEKYKKLINKTNRKERMQMDPAKIIK